jgi:ceramide glucosyltransferase
LKGVEPFSYATLASTFTLEPAPAEIFFCVESERDPIVPLVERLIASHPETPARLLVGRDDLCANPKLNNMAKGWRATHSDWIAFVDSNVLLPRDALLRLAGKIDRRTGMVSSPPVGQTRDGLSAHLECAFLNTHQARWQSVADSLGHGFAQGKVMYFDRRVIEAVGGIAALGREPAEDAAATKAVRSLGLRVRLVDSFFVQPIAQRTMSDVIGRQLRWAQLRRASFPLLFTTEMLAGPLAPMAAILVACVAADQPVLPAILLAGAFWYGVEHTVARWLGWPGTFVSSLLRDVLMPFIWLRAWTKRDFVWHGRPMRSERSAEQASG